MCEDERARDGDGTAEAARCGIGGKGRGGLCQWFRWGTVDDKVGEGEENDVRETSPQPGRRLRGGKTIGRKETGRMAEHDENEGVELEGDGREVDGFEGYGSEGDGREGSRSEGTRSAV